MAESDADFRAQFDAINTEARMVQEKDAPILQELLQGPDVVSSIKQAKLHALALARRNVARAFWAEHERMVANDWFGAGASENPSVFLDSITGEA